MKTQSVVLWGCGILTLGGVLAVAAGVLAFGYLFQDPEGVAVSVDGPAEVGVGQEFEVEVLVRNERPARPFKISDVDFAEDYLEGFTVSSIDPAPKSSTHVPLDDTRSFKFQTVIPAGETRAFRFKLRAVKPGIYRGEVDVCEGMRFLSGLVETVVVPQNPSAAP